MQEQFVFCLIFINFWYLLAFFCSVSGRDVPNLDELGVIQLVLSKSVNLMTFLMFMDSQIAENGQILGQFLAKFVFFQVLRNV